MLPLFIRRVFRLEHGRSDPSGDIESEIAFHVETRISALIAEGMSPEEARRTALRQFGPIEPVTRQVRAIDGGRHSAERRREWLAGLSQDGRLALRGMRRSPLYALIACLTFALGIGANTAVFSLLDGVVLRPLPFPEIDRLVRIYEHDLNEDRPFGQVTIADFRDWQRQSSAFDGLAAFRFRIATLTGTGEAVSLTAGQVSAGFFDLLGIRALQGRTFRPDEAVDGAPATVVLSHPAWLRMFGGDPSVIGRVVQLNGQPTEIIGVLPRDFVSPVGQPLDVWTTSDFEAVASDQARARRMHFLASFGRIREGVTVEAASAELLTIGRRLAAQYPDMNEGHQPQVVPLQEAGTTGVRPVLWLVMGAVGLVLLIACANLANLVFARSLSRSRELAVRTALGAGRWRLVRQVLIEQLLLASLGGLAGLLIASWTSRLFVGLLGDAMPRGDLIQVDVRVVAFALLVALASALLSGLLPAAHAARAEPGDQLRAGGQGSTLSRRSHRLRASLVTVQVGLATVLLVGSALALRSLRTLLDQELGFRPDSVWSFTAPAVPARYPDQPQILQFQARLLDELRRLPEVQAASAAYAIPMRNTSTTSFEPEGVELPPGPSPEVGYNAADGEYFRTMGIPLLRGRLMNPTDRSDGLPVAVVNQALADRWWPGQDPIGKRFRSGPDPASPWTDVIGVVGNLRRRSVQQPPEPEAYFALPQDLTRNPVYVVRVRGEAGPALAAIKSALQAIDREVPMGNLEPLSAVVAGSLRQPRFLTTLLAGFGGMALVLAAVGIYGVIAFLVAERRREIGVRLALGAGSGRMLRETLRRGLIPVAAGLGIGLVAAFGLARAARNLFFGVAPADPLAFGAASAVLFIAAVGGCLIPARRAGRVDPAMILRD